MLFYLKFMHLIFEQVPRIILNCATSLLTQSHSHFLKQFSNFRKSQVLIQPNEKL